MKDENPNLKLFGSLILNGILWNRAIMILFTLILISLSASCYFESTADEVFSTLGKKLEEKSVISSLTRYSFYYTLHLVFGWLHNYLFYTNVHFIKLLTYKYLMKRYMNTNLENFNQTGTGKTYSVIHKQTESTVFLLKNVILKLFYTLTYMVLFFKNMMADKTLDGSIKLAYLIVLMILLATIALSCWLSYIYKTKLIQAEHSNSHTLVNIFMNLSVVKAFNNEDSEIKRFEKQMAPEMALGYKFYFLKTLSDVIFKLMLFLFLVLPVFLSKASDINIFNSYKLLFLYFTMFSSFKRKINQLRKCIHSISDKFIDTHASSVAIKISNPERKPMKLENSPESIMFEKLSISLCNKLVFNNFSMTVNAGDKIAITGRNGAGKSTIIKALLGMTRYQGSILINGMEISKIDEKSLREMISYVPQDPHLFNTTVMDNLKYGKNISDEDVIQTCMRCGVHDIFKNLENGYFTVIGENAKNISGGQAQMINFMRAVIKDAPIFLLDEPTSNLDYAISNILLDKVFSVLKSKTVFFSTHCPYHLPCFDKIINVSDKTAKVFQGYAEFKKDPSFEAKF